MQRWGSDDVAAVSIAELMTTFGTGNCDAGRAVSNAHGKPALAGTPIDVVIVLKSVPHCAPVWPVTQLNP